MNAFAYVILFYKNLADMMHRCDQLQSQISFHPELLAIKEKESIKEIMLPEIEEDEDDIYNLERRT